MPGTEQALNSLAVIIIIITIIIMIISPIYIGRQWVSRKLGNLLKVTQLSGNKAGWCLSNKPHDYYNLTPDLTILVEGLSILASVRWISNKQENVVAGTIFIFIVIENNKYNEINLMKLLIVWVLLAGAF